MNNNYMGEWNNSQSLPEAFVQLPYQIYQHDSHWLGEDENSLRAQFSAANTWFDDGKAWLGVIENQARVVGFVSDKQIVDEQKAAFFGFWESTDNLEANQTLFRALSAWAKENGATHLYGPINFSTFSANRIRVDAFEYGAFLGEPWNPPYYSKLLNALGYEERYRYLSTFSPLDEIYEFVQNIYLPIKPFVEQKFVFEAMTPEFWLENLPTMYSFVNNVFRENFAYTPIDYPTFERLCGANFANKFCPKSSILAKTLEGDIAGFFLVYPDYSELVSPQNPHAINPNDIRYELHYPLLQQPRIALAKTVGVAKPYRAFNLFTSMSCELTMRCKGLYDTMCAPLMRSDNPSVSFAAKYGKSRLHHYALYQGTL